VITVPLRDHFPIFENKTFINSCSKGALSCEVEQAYLDYLRDWNDHGSPWELWMEKLHDTRLAFADLINASPEEVAVTTSVSAAVSAVASAIDFSGTRHKVVVSDFEFPTVAQVWHAQQCRGAEIVHVSETDGLIPLERYAASIDERTSIVSVSHACYRHGSRQDAKAIASLARSKGALTLLDSYQTLGTMPIDVKALEVDLLVGGALKYLLGSSGLAFLYVRKDLIPTLKPTTTGWFAQEDIFALDIYRHEPAVTARRFESGTPPVPNLYAAIAGIGLIRSVGTETIAAHLQDLTGALKEAARKRNFKLATPKDPNRHGALIALRAHHAPELVTRLEQDGIVVSSRDGNLRVSPHLYNTTDDIDLLVDRLSSYREFLVR
jgi:selenocysteine lyase/cysteine desulfurase